MSSLNQMAIQSALADIAERLEIIEQKIDDVLQGQRDDRAGLVDSAENLYIMASAASEAENRRLLLANAVAQLSEARGQMIRSLESSINSVSKIPIDKWKIIVSSLRKDIPKDVQRKSEILEATSREVLRASCLMALSCGQLGETVSLRESWQPLERLMPQIREVQAKVARWLPNQPNALPDKLSTLVSATDEVVQAGKQLESGTVRPLEIELRLDELTNGEGNS
jgi:septation ring formation regulator EzrA